MTLCPDARTCPPAPNCLPAPICPPVTTCAVVQHDDAPVINNWCRVLESTPPGSVVCPSVVDDNDFRCSIVGDDDYFKMLSDNSMVLSHALDFERRAEHVMQVDCINPCGKEIPFAMHVYVQDANECVEIEPVTFTVAREYIGVLGAIRFFDADSTGRDYGVSDPSFSWSDGRVSKTMPFDAPTTVYLQLIDGTCRSTQVIRVVVE